MNCSTWLIIARTSKLPMQARKPGEGPISAASLGVFLVRVGKSQPGRASVWGFYIMCGNLKYMRYYRFVLLFSRMGLIEGHFVYLYGAGLDVWLPTRRCQVVFCNVAFPIAGRFPLASCPLGPSTDPKLSKL